MKGGGSLICAFKTFSIVDRGQLFPYLRPAWYYVSLCFAVEIMQVNNLNGRKVDTTYKVGRNGGFEGHIRDGGRLQKVKHLLISGPYQDCCS